MNLEDQIQEDFSSARTLWPSEIWILGYFVEIYLIAVRVSIYRIINAKV